MLAALLAPEIVFVISGEDFDFAVADFEDARGQLIDEVTVVRDEDDRACVFDERIEQHVFGAQVEMVRRFVEQQEVRRMQQQAQQRVASALSAGEYADLLEDVFVGKEKTAEQAAQYGFAGARRRIAEIV